MSGHTRGPWRVIDYSSEGKGFIAVVGSTGAPEHICDVFPFGHRPGGIRRELEQHAANARLIAAAPELLQALKEIVHTESDPSHAKAHAAIAKAEGQS